MLDHNVIAGFVREQYGGPHRLSLESLRGGLETTGTTRVRVYGGAELRRMVGSFVVKPLAGSGMRELRVQEALHQAGMEIAPRVLGSASAGHGETYIFLEWVTASSRWPWRNTATTGLVLDRLARLHGAEDPAVKAAVAGWNYEAELEASAVSTIEAYGSGERPRARSMRPALARMAGGLRRIREQVNAFMGTSVLHGDAHPGNAVIPRSSTGDRALLIDWGRARIGSPLEDVSSWLQSLGFWEAEARRAHDQLLGRYLKARGYGGEISRQFRDAYWLAGACNAFAGALRYHLAVMNDPRRKPRERELANSAAADWLRIIRRADACWTC